MHPVLSIGLYLLMQVVILVLAYLCLRHDKNSRSSGKAVRWYPAAAVIYLLLSLMPVGGAVLPDSGFKFTLQRFGNVWLGFMVYFGGILLVLYILAGLLRLFAGHLPRKVRAGVLLVSFLAGLGLLGYGTWHAQRTIVTEYDVTIKKEAEDLEEMKVVLLADLHLSVNSHLPTIRRMVEMVNKEQPDVIVIAGDIFTSSYAGLRDPGNYAQVLCGLEARDGVYAVYGNHDVEETLFGGFPISPISQAFRTREMEQFFADCGFTVLYDETVSIGGGAVQLTGRVDGEKAGDGTADRKSPSEVLKDVDKEKPVLVLQHEPVEFAGLKENGADLALCGHTHAGQIFPGNLIVPFFNENAYGYKNAGGLDTIVTSGIGYYGPPMRVGTNSEITVVHIRFGK
ncbi:MAG: metallophosphoesterase [Blautia sp.]|nr:metallophosphoesterase [Blautia sp.]